MSDSNSNSTNFEINYSSLILGFSSAALTYLGYLPSQDVKVDFNLAKQNIDIIALIKDKTVGNLTQEEQSLTENILADLRMKYVEKLNNK